MTASMVVRISLEAQSLRRPTHSANPGSPLDHLPKNIELITNFGERADSSPDNQEIAFMAKSLAMRS